MTAVLPNHFELTIWIRGGGGVRGGGRGTAGPTPTALAHTSAESGARLADARHDGTCLEVQASDPATPSHTLPSQRTARDLRVDQFLPPGLYSNKVQQ